MKNALRQIILLALTLSLSGSAAQSQQDADPDSYYRPPSTLMGKTVVIPVGTTFEGRIDSKIGSSASRPGERFTITMSSPVLANGTDVLIPAGSQVIGEVVEAIPSGRVAHERGTPKPKGKLRVQLNGLRTPDGVNYPLVASLIGESSGTGRQQQSAEGLGGGVAYMGSSASFDAVAPGMSERYRNRRGRGPTVMTREQILQDPIYGMGNDSRYGQYGRNQNQIRSLVQRGNELVIEKGSPLSIRLNAPFKISFSSSSNYSPSVQPELDESGKRFSRSAPQAQPEQAAASSPTPASAPPPPARPRVIDNSF